MNYWDQEQGQYRPPGLAEAKGGKSVRDLHAGRVEIPGFDEDDWYWDCDQRENGKQICGGIGHASCIKSYREDNPGLDSGKSGSAGLDIEALSLEGGKSVTYHYGPGTGYASAAKEVENKLALGCAQDFVKCAAESCK